MRGADYAGDTRKGHPFPLNIFLSSGPDIQIPTVIRVQDLGPFELVLDCGKGGRSSLCTCPTAPRHSYASVQKKSRRRVTDYGFDHNQSRVVISDFV
ncbi:hypothetical protein Peur_056834 [Populus x canadensis]